MEFSTTAVQNDDMKENEQVKTISHITGIL